MIPRQAPLQDLIFTFFYFNVIILLVYIPASQFISYLARVWLEWSGIREVGMMVVLNNSTKTEAEAKV